MIKMKKSIFLLNEAEEFELEDSKKFKYSYSEQINFVEKNGKKVPAVSIEMSGPTHSKTARKPGDDDPDDETCY
jgi:hypothetical protein